jgi:NAD(P)-dependent dehydrogenase (short-subunit alcohol dehydrogenase family)
MKRILITGATGAVGRVAALEIARQGNGLILIGRNVQRLEKVKDEIGQQTGNKEVFLQLADMGEPSSVQEAISEIKARYTTLDALVNVAAIYKKDRHVNSRGQELMFATNHLGPFVLTNGLLDVLRASGAGRVVTVSAPSTSKLNFEDLQGAKKFSALQAFGASKMANLLFTYDLARRIQGTGVTTTVFHPGLVKSELTNEMPGFLRFLFSLMSGKPDRAGAMLARLAVDPAFKDANGKFFKFTGKEMQSNAYSHDKAVQEQLWKLSEEMVK